MLMQMRSTDDAEEEEKGRAVGRGLMLVPGVEERDREEHAS